MKIKLKTYNGVNFVCAENGGGQELVANRTLPREWETFDILGNFVYGGSISLKTYNGVHFVCAEDGGGKGLVANRTEAHQWETFKVIGPNGKIDGSPVRNGDKISLQTYDNKHFICAENGGGQELVANRAEAHEWETFTIQFASITLKTYDGTHFVCAENGGGQKLVANSTEAREWETFDVLGEFVFGGNISLRTYDKIHFVCAENGGGQELIASKIVADIWETFKIIGLNGKTDGSLVQCSDKISLKTYDGQHYVCAEGGGNRELVANRTEAHEWETFTVQYVTNEKGTTSPSETGTQLPYFPHEEPIPKPMKYKFRFDSIKIDNTRSMHEDTVYVSFTLQAKNQPTQNTQRQMGDLNNGTYNVGIEYDVDVYPGTDVVMVYQVVNSGHSDPSQKLYQFAMGMIKKAIDGGANAAGQSLGGTSWWGKIIQVALSGIPDLTSILYSIATADCDGYLAAEPALAFQASYLSEITQQSNPYRKQIFYAGTDSPDGCGSNSKYYVTWQILRVGDIPTLIGAELITHTNNDNKDHDTGVFVRIYDQKDRTLAKVENADYSDNDSTEYEDNTSHTIKLRIENGNATYAQCKNFKVKIWQRTNGNDTWKFNSRVVLKFSDGTSLESSKNDIKLVNDWASVSF